MYFNKKIIFSILFEQYKAFDILEFKTKPPGSYSQIGIHVPFRTCVNNYYSLWDVDGLVRLGTMFGETDSQNDWAVHICANANLYMRTLYDLL